jgi:hypothetical protein
LFEAVRYKQRLSPAVDAPLQLVLQFGNAHVGVGQLIWK